MTPAVVLFDGVLVDDEGFDGERLLVPVTDDVSERLRDETAVIDLEGEAGADSVFDTVQDIDATFVTVPVVVVLRDVLGCRDTVTLTLQLRDTDRDAVAAFVADGDVDAARDGVFDRDDVRVCELDCDAVFVEVNDLEICRDNEDDCVGYLVFDCERDPVSVANSDVVADRARE